MQFKPLEWLALQRAYPARPKQTHQVWQSGRFSLTRAAEAQAKKDWEKMQSLGVQLLHWESSGYPPLLKEIYDPPMVLMAKGSLQTLTELPWIAVVGARKASRWGREQARELAKQFVAEGYGIVSGLAYGIDSEAHQAALAAGGKSWGVLGSGLDCIYPRSHRRLAERLTLSGGILSEFPLGTGPERYHFPQRNRIISGLSRAVVIVEATAKSGSLITGRFALEQGREVWVAVPPEESYLYEGNFLLLEEGATPIGGTYRPRTKPSLTHPLLQWMRKPCSLDQLAGQTRRTPQSLLVELTKMECAGLIRKLPGALWQSR